MLEKNEIRSIVEQLKGELLPIGCILIYPSEKIPTGFLPCDGRELSKKTFPELYALIKDTWGETDNSFFLPDLQGRFIRGWDKEQNIDPERKLGSLQEDAFQGHAHITEKAKGNTKYGGNHTHEVYSEEHGGGMGTIFYSLNHKDKCYSESCKKGKVFLSPSGTHNHEIELEVKVTDPVNSTYGKIRVATETRPTNVALIYCIKVK